MMSSKNVIRTIVYLFAAVNFVSSLNILGIFPYPGKSHFIVYRVYLQELVRRGHSVTVISHFPEAEPIPNYQDVSLAGSIKILEDDFPFDKSYTTLLYTGIYLVTTGRENCKAMLGNKGVQELIAKKPKFDVVVVEQFNSDCALGVAYKLGAPVIGINSHILMPWHYSRFGIPQNPAFVPFHFLDGGSKPSLFQKIEVTVFDLYYKALYYLYEQRGDENTLAQYFDDIPPLETLARDIKLLLLYHNFVLTGSRLFPANVIEVGGYHVAKSKPLPKDLQKFMDEAQHGVIYISFGSVIKSSTMPEDKLNAVLETMKSLPQRFIWKWESKTRLLDKDKLYVSSWLPQVDILGHPKTLAFLSHAGMGGTTESLHYGVPIAAMPMFGDQPSNAAAIEESGLGVRIQAEKLSKESLLAAFQKVLHPSFRENVKRLSAAWHDRPLPPLQSAVYWTEFAARHHNLTFRTPAADLPFYQYYNLDVILVYAIIILITVTILKKIVSLMCRKKTPSPDQKSKTSKKSKKNN